MPPENRLTGLDCLRGVAICMVIIVHTNQLVPVGAALSPLIEQVARGVQLFFVISGFTLMLSMEKTHPSQYHRWSSFAIRRTFRIVPMFWIACIGWYLLTAGIPSHWSPDGPGLTELLLTLLFLNNFGSTTHSAIVPGGWSIGAEVNMYLLFPFLTRVTGSVRSSVYVAILGIIGGFLLSILAYFLFMPDSIHPALTRSFLNSYWLPVSLPSFLIGIATYRLSSTIDISDGTTRKIVVYAVVAAVGLAYTALPLKAILYGPIFGAFCLAASRVTAHSAVLVPLVCLGKLSYSAYFLHFVVLYFAKNSGVLSVGGLVPSTAKVLVWQIAILVITVASSTITYIWIEQPFIRLGTRLIKTTIPR